MRWTIEFSRHAKKQAKRLNKRVLAVLWLLVKDLETRGPAPGKQWQSYGRLHCKSSVDYRHCHLIKGKPTYVCCWKVVDQKIRIIEVYYVGSHEKAPY